MAASEPKVMPNLTRLHLEKGGGSACRGPASSPQAGHAPQRAAQPQNIRLGARGLHQIQLQAYAPAKEIPAAPPRLLSTVGAVRMYGWRPKLPQQACESPPASTSDLQVQSESAAANPSSSRLKLPNRIGADNRSRR